MKAREDITAIVATPSQSIYVVGLALNSLFPFLFLSHCQSRSGVSKQYADSPSTLNSH